MRVGGAWVGWGLGDDSSSDLTVRRAKDYMRRMFRSYAGNLADTNTFDQQMAAAVFEMQTRLLKTGKLAEGRFLWSVLDMATQVAMGFRKPSPKALPIIFTVEGHMSDMFVGPCAFTAQTLEGQGVCHWKPIGYNNTAMPFDNDSGVRALCAELGRDKVEGPPGVLWPFPAGTPWGLIVFSQGGIVGGETLLKHVLPEGADLHWRLKDMRRSLSFGNPYREVNQCAPWVFDPPDRDTQGISDVRLNATQIRLPNGDPLSTVHREHARHGDLYAENQTTEMGEKKTAVYKAVQHQLTGKGSLLNEVAEIFEDPIHQIYPLVQAIWTGGMFLFNMGPHGQYLLEPCVEWMRAVKP